jgi:hypothetical protein
VKSYATFVMIAVMTAGLLFLLLTRDRTSRDAPAEVVEILADSGADAAIADAATGAGVDAAHAAPPGEKPIRVTTLGWDLVAAGAALTPPDGGAPPPPAPPIELAPETSLDAIEARLARGSSDPQGADVAIMPLPAFVAAYEKIRALEPRAFLVVGFSHGREELHAAAGALLKAPPGADEVKLVAAGESPTVLGLFALDALGVAPARVRLVAPDSPDAKAAAFAAVARGTPEDRKLAFSTVDAARLVPIVAVAPNGLLAERAAALREWSKAWLDGLGRVSADAPGTARRLAAKEALPLAAGVGGAPEALSLVERLGQIERVALADEGRWIGTGERGPVTLESLTQRTWQLARGGGLTTSAAPEPLPVDARIASAIAPAWSPPAKPEDAPDAGLVFGPLESGGAAILAYRATEGDLEKAAAQIAFLAGVFDRAGFKITAKGGDKAARALATAAHARGVPLGRLAVAGTEPGIFANVEIVSPP